MPIILMLVVTIWLNITTIEQGHVALGHHAIWPSSTT
jgi:hypothetical protein